MGHSLKNFTLNNTETQTPYSLTGLFSSIGSQGRVENLNLMNTTIKFSDSNSYVGALAGLNTGTIHNVSIENLNVQNRGNIVGGLVGKNGTPNAKVSSSFGKNITLVGGDYVGGLVGFNGASANIENTYINGLAIQQNSQAAGGLVGYNAGFVLTSFANHTALKNAGANAHALIGSNRGLAQGNTVYNSDVTAKDATVLNATQLKQSSSYADFDFKGSWVIYENHTTPLLRNFMQALTITQNETLLNNSHFIGDLDPNFKWFKIFSIKPDTGHLFGITQTDLWSDQRGYLITYQKPAVAQPQISEKAKRISEALLSKVIIRPIMPQWVHPPIQLPLKIETNKVGFPFRLPKIHPAKNNKESTL